VRARLLDEPRIQSGRRLGRRAGVRRMRQDSCLESSQVSITTSMERSGCPRWQARHGVSRTAPAAWRTTEQNIRLGRAEATDADSHTLFEALGLKRSPRSLSGELSLGLARSRRAPRASDRARFLLSSTNFRVARCSARGASARRVARSWSPSVTTCSSRTTSRKRLGWRRLFFLSAGPARVVAECRSRVRARRYAGRNCGDPSEIERELAKASS